MSNKAVPAHTQFPYRGISEDCCSLRYLCCYSSSVKMLSFSCKGQHLAPYWQPTCSTIFLSVQFAISLFPLNLTEISTVVFSLCTLYYFWVCFCFFFLIYFVLFYFLEHFNKFLGVFSASAIGMPQHCPDNVSAAISCSKFCRISSYIAVRNSCQEKRVANWFFIEKHRYIYLVCYYKYSSSRLWPGEFQAHWGQWKSGTWLQWNQDFHPDFCLFGELELTMIVDKNPGTTQQFQKK